MKDYTRAGTYFGWVGWAPVRDCKIGELWLDLSVSWSKSTVSMPPLCRPCLQEHQRLVAVGWNSALHEHGLLTFWHTSMFVFLHSRFQLLQSPMLPSARSSHRITQNQRMLGVGRDLCPVLLPYSLQDLVGRGLIYSHTSLQIISWHLRSPFMPSISSSKEVAYGHL